MQYLEENKAWYNYAFRPLQSIGSLADKCFVSQIIRERKTQMLKYKASL